MSSPSSVKPSSTTPSAIGLVIRLTLAVVVYGLFATSRAPHPEALDGFLPRLEYHRQLALHLLGLQRDWDVPALAKVYSAYLASTNKSITLPVPTGTEYAYQLRKLDEIDPSRESDWETKLRRKVSSGEPVVVRKLQYFDVKGFPEAKKWNIDFLREEVFPDNQKIPVFTDTRNDKSVIHQGFADYVSGLGNKTRKWYARCLDDTKKKILSGFDAQHLADLMGKRHEAVATNAANAGIGYCTFVGSSHVNTRMHSDTTTSAFLMIQGRKRWTLFPPSESMYVLPVGHEMNVAYNSRVDIFADKERLLREYPFLSLARGFEVILEPGDVLFFSSFNWHGVQNLDELTIGIDFPVFDPLSSWGRNAPLTLGTYLNLPAVLKVLEGYFKGAHGLKQIFFQGYALDDETAEAIKKQEGVI